ncbi:MAG: DUF4432 family protein [Nitrososphaerales archaeon]
MRTLILENRTLRMVVLVDKGSDVMELRHKPKDVDVLWHSPVGYRVRSSHGGLLETPDSGFMDGYGGGWQDILPSTDSGPLAVHGAPFGLHGESAVVPWEARIEQEGGETARATLTVEGLRYPYRVEKTMSLRADESVVRIGEKLTNTGRQRLEFYWLHHPAYGEPFLAPGCRVELPHGSRVVNPESINPRGRVAGGEFDWPVVRARDGSGPIDLSLIPPKGVRAEETNFVRVREGRYSVTNEALGLSVGLRWDASVFPWVWFWQNYGTLDYPYYGRAWNVALEPSTSLPTIMDQKEHAGTLALDGGASMETEIRMSLDATDAPRP